MPPSKQLIVRYFAADVKYLRGEKTDLVCKTFLITGIKTGTTGTTLLCVFNVNIIVSVNILCSKCIFFNSF